MQVDTWDSHYITLFCFVIFLITTFKCWRCLFLLGPGPVAVGFPSAVTLLRRQTMVSQPLSHQSHGLHPLLSQSQGREITSGQAQNAIHLIQLFQEIPQ